MPLPSVGPGNFLRDIIESEIFPITRLNKIYRQEEDSDIAINAHRINNGEGITLNRKSGNFFILKKENEEEVCETLKGLMLEGINKYFSHSIDILKDVQILSPVRKGTLGVNNLNLIFQNIINPKNSKKEELDFLGNTFRVGDKVMQIKNNYELNGYYIENGKQIKGVFNGDIGYIVEINKGKVKVLYDGNKIFVYGKQNLSEIEYAYAITVHKSQGSEFPVIIIPVFKFAYMMMNRNILYTAVTRAKKCVILVGDVGCLSHMIKNKSSVVRYSALKYLFNEFVSRLDEV